MPCFLELVKYDISRYLAYLKSPETIRFRIFPLRHSLDIFGISLREKSAMAADVRGENGRVTIIFERRNRVCDASPTACCGATTDEKVLPLRGKLVDENMDKKPRYIAELACPAARCQRQLAGENLRLSLLFSSCL